MLRATASRAAASLPPSVHSCGLLVVPTTESLQVSNSMPLLSNLVDMIGGHRLRHGRAAWYAGGQRRGMCIKSSTEDSDNDHQQDMRREKMDEEELLKVMTTYLDYEPPLPELSEEERQRNFEIGKRYNSMMAAQNNKRLADYSMKIRLRDDAIENLPELLQHPARQKDLEAPPANRKIALDHPPQEETMDDKRLKYKTMFKNERS